ncbi:MAG: hypothetical protein M5U29_11325 [Anaerolineae bacterium]|nr:hypothetical protein [Anaerolineae bacterium]
MPTFDAFREPVRWLILTHLGLALLAGIGVGHWGRGPRAVYWSRLAAAGGGGMALLALGARAFANLTPRNWTRWPWPWPRSAGGSPSPPC